MDAALERAHCTIGELKAAGRIDEAIRLEQQINDIARLAKAALEPKSDHARAVEELSKTSQMIGEHLTATCMRGGEIIASEVAQSSAFFLKAIPMLQLQIKMVRIQLAEVPASEQQQFAGRIHTAQKCLNLVQMLQSLNERGDGEGPTQGPTLDDYEQAKALTELLIRIAPQSLPPAVTAGVAAALFTAADVEDCSRGIATESEEALQRMATVMRRATSNEPDLEGHLTTQLSLWFDLPAQSKAREAFARDLNSVTNPIRWHQVGPL